MSVTPDVVLARVCAGVDWAKDDHAIAIVDALLQAELTVLVIAPGQLKNLRSRYGSAGNKDDRYDAYILADVVRTDRRRLRPLVRDSAGTTALRTSVRARRDLVEHRVAAANQLRAHLQIVFPAAAGLFAAIDSQINLRFLERFTTQVKADWLSPKRLASWLSSVGYSGRTSPEVLHTRLLSAPRGARVAEAETHAVTTLAYVATLHALNTQIDILADSIGEQLAIHPDAHIVTSLPRSGTADSLACLAGVAPSTRQSGKVKAVTFRWGANKQLRDALCDFAGDSRRANPWAAQLYANARARGHVVPPRTRSWCR